MAWGTNKFFKKLIKPNAIPNNELADFISRVPDNEELVGEIIITAYCNKKMLMCVYLYIYISIFCTLQKDAQEMPSPEDVAKAKLQVKKKPASDAEVI